MFDIHLCEFNKLSAYVLIFIYFDMDLMSLLISANA